MSGSFLINLPDSTWRERFNLASVGSEDSVIRWNASGYCVDADVLAIWFELGLIDGETYCASLTATEAEFEQLTK